MAVILIINAIVGGLCAAIASSKGRSAVGWFFIGFFFGLVALIIVLVLSNLKDERRRFEEISADRRRLKEQLRQERLKSESFRRYATERIDTHDRVLGVNTKTVPELAPGADGAVPALPRADLDPLVTAPGGSGWFYEKAGTPQGPVAQAQLASMLRSGEVSASTLVWTETMAEWTPAREVPEFRGASAS